MYLCKNFYGEHLFFKPLHLIPMLLISIVDRNPTVSCLGKMSLTQVAWTAGVSTSPADGYCLLMMETIGLFTTPRKCLPLSFQGFFIQAQEVCPNQGHDMLWEFEAPYPVGPSVILLLLSNASFVGNLEQSTRTWKNPSSPSSFLE